MLCSCLLSSLVSKCPYSSSQKSHQLSLVISPRHSQNAPHLTPIFFWKFLWNFTHLQHFENDWPKGSELHYWLLHFLRRDCIEFCWKFSWKQSREQRLGLCLTQETQQWFHHFGYFASLRTLSSSIGSYFGFDWANWILKVFCCGCLQYLPLYSRQNQDLMLSHHLHPNSTVLSA